MLHPRKTAGYRLYLKKMPKGHQGGGTEGATQSLWEQKDVSLPPPRLPPPSASPPDLHSTKAGVEARKGEQTGAEGSQGRNMQQPSKRTVQATHVEVKGRVCVIQASAS